MNTGLGIKYAICVQKMEMYVEDHGKLASVQTEKIKRGKKEDQV